MCVISYIKNRFLPLLSEVLLAFFSAIAIDAFLLGPDLLLVSLQPFLLWVLCFAPFGLQWLSEDYQKHKWNFLLEGGSEQ
jgi:hypothetical protein